MRRFLPVAGAIGWPSGPVPGCTLAGVAVPSTATAAAGGGSSPALRPHAASPRAPTSAPSMANLSSERSNVWFTHTPLNRRHHSRSDGRGESIAKSTWSLRPISPLLLGERFEPPGCFPADVLGRGAAVANTAFHRVVDRQHVVDILVDARLDHLHLV